MAKWTVDIKQIEGTDELYLELPQDLLKEMNWQEGTMVEWLDNGDGSWRLKQMDPLDEMVAINQRLGLYDE